MKNFNLYDGSLPKISRHLYQYFLPILKVEVGNVEYKLKLLNPTASRFEHLVTQMKWRLREGQGEAIYEIGVADNGLLRGLSDTEMDDSIATLKKMADRYSYILILYNFKGSCSKCIVCIHGVFCHHAMTCEEPKATGRCTYS